MKLRNYLIILILTIVLMHSISTIFATSNENMTMVHEIDYNNNENVSIGYNEVNENEGILLNNLDNNNEIVREFDDESDEDIDDELDDENSVLDDEDIEEYLSGIDASDEYLKFVKYLIKNKKFRFNNFLDQSEDDNADDSINNNDDGEGYYIYASETYNGKAYDGSELIIPLGHEYYVPITQRINYILDDYCPDIIYLKDNHYSLDEFYLGWLINDEKYQSCLYSSNKNTLPSTPFYTSLELSSFDLRNVNGQNYTTPVKNQGTEGNCWAFAPIAALESHLLKTENKSYEFSTNIDYSENNLKNVMSSLGEMGTDMLVNGGGNIGMSIPYFIRWSGPILESQDKYLNNDVMEDYKALKHVQGVIYIPPRNNSTDNDRIKEAVYNYGGVVTSLYWSKDKYYEVGQNYYNPNQIGKIWHEICIIGWDDNYSKTNFGLQLDTMGDGAFIVKNSWGNTEGDDGYYYVSYYDITLAKYGDVELGGATGYAFTLVENNTNYGKNYNYSPLGVTSWEITNSNYAKYRNQWTTDCNVTLKSCGVYVNDAVNCSINITINNQRVGGANKTLNYGGFHTIPLKDAVKINKGETFAVEITLTSNIKNILLPIEMPWGNYSKATSNIKESEYSNGKDWVDISTKFKNTNYCIHAYTEYGNLTPTKIEASDLTIRYGENIFIIATLYDSNNIPLKNNEITFSINNEDYKAITNDDGQASIQINKDVGTYKIIIRYFGNEKYEDSRKTITLSINSHSNIQQKTDVKINLNDVEINSIIKFQLTSSNNNPLSGEKVILKIGSKKYTKSLDMNGYFISKKIFKNPSKIKVIYKGSERYNKKTKSAYIYDVITKINGFKSCKDDEKLSLSISVKKLNVYFTLSGEQKKIKFRNKKATFNVKNFKLKKGKTYTLKFTSKSKLWHVKYTYKLKIKK